MSTMSPRLRHLWWLPLVPALAGTALLLSAPIWLVIAGGMALLLWMHLWGDWIYKRVASLYGERGSHSARVDQP